MSAIRLYVDKLFNDAQMGITNSPSTIAYNNNILGEKFTNILTDIVASKDRVKFTGYSGRYLFTVMIDISISKYEMAFIDLQNDESKMRELARTLNWDDKDSDLIKTFFDQSEQYDQIYDETILVEGIPEIDSK